MSLISKTNEIVKHFNFKFSKGLGQNFLIDQNVLEKIVEAANLDDNSCVIEIGPGIGTLTQELSKHAKKVIAIELDDDLIEVLNETLANFSNIKIIHADALKVDFKKLIEDEGIENVRVVANLPYYVTTPLISKLFTEKPGVHSITVMIQKEVAQRSVAKPDTPEYGALSVLIQYYSKAQIIAKVAPTCFMPKPKVDSAVIRMDIRDTPKAKVMDEKLFFKIVRSAFNMRRKTMWNVLKQIGLTEEKLREVFLAAGIDKVRRGETYSIEEFAILSDKIKIKLDEN